MKGSEHWEIGLFLLRWFVSTLYGRAVYTTGQMLHSLIDFNGLLLRQRHLEMKGVTICLMMDEFPSCWNMKRCGGIGFCCDMCPHKLVFGAGLLPTGYKGFAKEQRNREREDFRDRSLKLVVTAKCRLFFFLLPLLLVTSFMVSHLPQPFVPRIRCRLGYHRAQRACLYGFRDASMVPPTHSQAAWA